MNVTQEELAKTFLTVLRAWLKHDEFAEACVRNAQQEHPDICHTHDFCDANEAMAEAMERHGIVVDVDDDAQHALWNAAWNVAKVEMVRLGKAHLDHREVRDAQ